MNPNPIDKTQPAKPKPKLNYRIKCSAINHHHAEIGKPKPPNQLVLSSTTTTPASPSHPILCFNRKPKEAEEQREKREEKGNEKKKEKVSDEIRGEREKIRMKYQ